MSLLTSTILTLGFFANAALAGGYTDAALTTTETQEIGSITSEGAIWYSMNVCEIVQHTECDISLSQGGAAPPEETGGSGDYPLPTGPEASAPASSEPEYSPPPSGEEPIPSEGGKQPPSAGPPKPAPTDGGEKPPPSKGPAPSEGEGGGSQPAPTILTTSNGSGKETTVPGSLAPATTNADGSVIPSGSATEEPTGSSTTAGAFALVPAAVPAFAWGALAFLLVAI